LRRGKKKAAYAAFSFFKEKITSLLLEQQELEQQEPQQQVQHQQELQQELEQALVLVLLFCHRQPKQRLT